LIPSEDRGVIVALLEEGISRGVSAKAIADLFGLATRTLRRWGLMIRAQGFSRDQRKGASRHVMHRFSEEERQQVLSTVNDPRFADLTPNQIVAILSEEGDYVGSESTIYRIMRQEGLLHHRGRSRPPREPREPPVLEATGIHQVLAWDITLLPGPVRGQFYYLYMVLDVWSRRILGVEVHERECGELAKHFFDRVCRDEGINSGSSTILHADNGNAMRAATLESRLEELGVLRSFSRPRISNDNPYSESLFRTAKYRPDYPRRPFASVEEACLWVASFVDWYNHRHRHSGIKFVTPAQRHSGQAVEICRHRAVVYEQARQRHPRRWSRSTRCWRQPEVVWINPPPTEIEHQPATFDMAA
jgi:transposase InsO family protein